MKVSGKSVLNLGVLIFLVLGGLMATACQAQNQPKEPRYRVLVYSKTAGFRHSSIPDGIAAIWRMGEKNNFAVDASEDPTIFNDDILSRYRVIVFMSTTGDILNPEQQAAFERWFRKGNGFVGVHAAADTEYEWPWFGEMVGGYFKSHPQQQEADVVVEDKNHPSTAHLPDRWHRFDEWYNYRQNPRGKVHVLCTLDEKTYKPGNDAMTDHPISWYREFDGGRSFYTGMGHTEKSFVEAEFVQHVLGGIEWAAGVAPIKRATN